MSKEAAETPAGRPHILLRPRPVRPAVKAGLDWLSRRPAGTAGALGAVFLLALWLVSRPPASFSRRKIDFPAPPKLDAAIAAAQERLKTNPQDLAALVDLGTLHFQKGKDAYPDAINELEEARDLGALDARVFYCLGIMYQEVGLYPFALEEYRRFLRHYPDDREVRLLEAKLLYREASQIYQQGQAAGDKKQRLALLARASTEFGQAVSEYERLRYRYPGDALVEENLGLSLWGAGAVDRAVENFNDLKSKGGDAGRRSLFYLAEIALAQGRAQDAVDGLLQCQKQPGAPDFGIPQYQIDAALGAAYEKLKQPSLAVAAWQKVLTENPDDAKSKDAKAALRRLSRLLPKKRRKG